MMAKNKPGKKIPAERRRIHLEKSATLTIEITQNYDFQYVASLHWLFSTPARSPKKKKTSLYLNNFISGCDKKSLHTHQMPSKPSPKRSCRKHRSYRRRNSPRPQAASGGVAQRAGGSTLSLASRCDPRNDLLLYQKCPHPPNPKEKNAKRTFKINNCEL